MSRLLIQSSLRHASGHPWQTLLSVLGVSLGVAVVFSIDLVNQSAQTAFRLATDSVVGRTTHQVVASGQGIPDSSYVALRKRLAIRDAAPVVEGYVGLSPLPGRAFHLLGVDPLAEGPFRRRIGAERISIDADLAPLLTGVPSVYLPRTTADELGIAVGDSLSIHTPSGLQSVTVLGWIDDLPGRGLSNLILADISTAQELLDSVGWLSRIDLIAPDEDREAFLAKVERTLPQGARILRAGARTEQVEQMSTAFTQNLFALSLLALVVGMFLIYNAMTFSVVQRRAWMGDLRTLGVTRGEIYRLGLVEAITVGVVGTAIGLTGGFGLARLLLGMVTQTINDLFFVLQVERLSWSGITLLKSAALGVGATLAAAAVPAVEAMRTSPRAVQNRSSIEARARGLVPRLALAGIGFLLFGAGALLVDVRSVFYTFAGLLPLIAGFALITPAILLLLLNVTLTRPLGWTGRLAARSIVAQLSRSGVAIAALSIAVGTTVGVTTMIDSFRKSVLDWLDGALDADVYVTRPYMVASQNDVVLESDLVKRILSLDGVESANFVRGRRVETQHGAADLVALRLLPGGEKKYRYLEGDVESAWPRLLSGKAVLISEPYAYRHGVTVGDSVRVNAAEGPRSYVIAGVYADYSSDLGTVMIDLDAYRSAWNDQSLSGVGLRLREGSEAGAVTEAIYGLLDESDEITVQTPGELRAASIEIFDRTFAITHVLRVLTVVVAFIGVLSALMALQFERSRELGVLRALGLTQAQLWRLVTLQTGMMGLVSGLLALPFGSMLALVLVHVVNKRSFGWSLQMDWRGEVFAQAVLVAILAALLAGIYPAYKMSRTSPARALHEE